MKAPRSCKTRSIVRLVQPRGVIVPWKYFLAVYFLLLVGAAVGIYLWQTRIYRARAPSRKRTIDYDYEQEHEFLIKGTRSSYLRSQWAGGWLCASPWIIGFILFTGGPILFAIVASFCDYDILNPAALCRPGKLSLDVDPGPAVLESDRQYPLHGHRYSTRYGAQSGYRSSA